MRKEEFLAHIKLDPKIVQNIYGVEELNEIKNSKQLFYFTGKGPSNQILHLGHYLVFKKFAEISKENSVLIQISNDEKRNIKSNYITLDKAVEYGENAIKELKSYFEWNYDNTYLIENLEPNTNYLLQNVANYISKHIKIKTVLGAFGNYNIYSAYYVALQLAPILIYQKIKPNSRCVLITADDQKACFLIMRDISKKLGLKKPIIVVLKGLKDIKMKDKMSASNCKNALCLKPTLNLKTISKGVSAPFYNNKPDPENDYIAHLVDYLMSFNFCKEDLTQIYNSYKINKTGEIKEKLLHYLESYFLNMPENKSDLNFKNLILKNEHRSAINEWINKFEDSYLDFKV